MTTQQHIDIKFWLLAGLTFLLSGLMTFMNLKEFVTIGLLKQTTNYPFGGEGSVPWYYETADLYAKVSFAFGLGFLSAFVAGIWTTFKRNKTGLFIALLSSIFLIVIMFVNGQAD
ncbi:hypothetical protein [Arcicella rosea]|uniref:DUF1772 domain-containing protein n=1 Tax=Arcicella rosea TaxID=502909 RepID=A0A841EPX7_9BACT|nr:hypothetical protein [Arcicella rosea]MBB6002330.1 hypothetical protein [Arcicella rosea]